MCRCYGLCAGLLCDGNCCVVVERFPLKAWAQSKLKHRCRFLLGTCTEGPWQSLWTGSVCPGLLNTSPAQCLHGPDAEGHSRAIGLEARIHSLAPWWLHRRERGLRASHGAPVGSRWVSIPISQDDQQASSCHGDIAMWQSSVSHR